MNKDIKEKWVTALRSGEYEQGRGYLAVDGKYCCLGILCELAHAEGITNKATHQGTYAEYSVYGKGMSAGVLPSEVIEWAGLSSDNPELEIDDTLQTAATWNDAGTAFEVIAKGIEDTL